MEGLGRGLVKLRKGFGVHYLRRTTSALIRAYSVSLLRPPFW